MMGPAYRRFGSGGQAVIRHDSSGSRGAPHERVCARDQRTTHLKTKEKETPAMQNHMESEAGRISGLAIQEAGSSYPFSRLGDGNIPFPLQSTEWQSENYQVALVPLGNTTNHAGKLASAMEMASILVLPLTWRELMLHLHSQAEKSVFLNLQIPTGPW